jgi:enolase
MVQIASIECYRVINSRAGWTIRTKVTLSDGSVGIQTVPEGASKGENEALYVSPHRAVETVEQEIFPAIKQINPYHQHKIDKAMIEMDNSPNKRILGGNSILSISLAVAKACANSRGIPLYKYLAHLYGNNKLSFPTPIFNVLNGGKHATNALSFQEFMVIPAMRVRYDKALEMGVSVYQELKKMLIAGGFSTDVGDEGGFAPQGFTVDKALHFVREAANTLYKTGEDIFLGMDVAAESFYEKSIYNIQEETKAMEREEFLNYYSGLITKYELIYIEDPFYENDHEGWEAFYSRFKDRVMVVADDLVVTNPKFLRNAIENKLANAVIVKPNQVGTLTETFEFIRMARKAGMSIIVSHRSGETGEDTFISDLALAVGAEFIKSGAPARGERVVKYNRLLEVFYATQV